METTGKDVNATNGCEQQKKGRAERGGKQESVKGNERRRRNVDVSCYNDDDSR